MINILLLDDEDEWIKKIYNDLSYYAFMTDHDYRFFLCTTLEDAKQIIESNDIHLIVSDIELRNDNTISFLKYISQKFDIIIIYITSYDKYALQSFGLNVYQFILKKDMENQIKKVIDFCEEYFFTRGDIKLKTTNGTISLKYKDIYYIDCYLRDIYVYTCKNTYKIKSLNLNELYDKLPKYFVMISRSTIINTKLIKLINNDEVLLKNDIKLHVSRRRKKEVLEKYVEYLEFQS